MKFKYIFNILNEKHIDSRKIQHSVLSGRGQFNAKKRFDKQ